MALIFLFYCFGFHSKIKLKEMVAYSSSSFIVCFKNPF
ncbi:hypothetical protein HPSA_05330 [Helicobacter pylori SouthAfrica7]|uniref:Uncharacterized protein n=1 Tax=Helicobacter pylori (strain SouthAfrica7) TaxID=907239 RepID=E8QSS6_HELPW|nr:hypothetical protein HPSA_05330 [Helicobacter pylori SouthAfrica7]